MLNFLVGLAIAAFFVYVACIFGSTSFVMLGFALAVLVVLSFIVAIFSLLTTKVKIDIPLMIVEKDSLFHALITIDSRMPFGIKCMRFTVKYGNSMRFKRKRVKLVAENIPRGKSEYSYEISISSPGNYEFKLSRVRVYDYLGVFYLGKRTKLAANAILLPTVDSVPVIIGDRIMNFYGDSDVYDKTRAGYDPGETFDVREFRQGDSLTSVHWKMSAKKEDLIVRDKSLPKACPVVLVLNLDRKCNERLLHKAATVSFSLMDNGCPHYVAWFRKTDQNLVRLRVDDEESFYEFMVNFMQDESPRAVPELMNLYREKYRGDYWLHEVLFEAGRVLLDGEEVSDDPDAEIILT